MKVIIIHLLVLIALVYGQHETHEHSHGGANPRYGKAFKSLLQNRRDKQICVPDSKYEDVCLGCFCTKDGTKIVCLRTGSCRQPSRRRRDTPSATPVTTYTIKSCSICTCEPSGLCIMRYHEVCPLDLNPPQRQRQM